MKFGALPPPDKEWMVGKTVAEIQAIQNVFDHIADEKLPLTFDKFLTILACDLHAYRKAFVDPMPVNDWHEKPHTFDEWMASFARFISW